MEIQKVFFFKNQKLKWVVGNSVDINLPKLGDLDPKLELGIVAWKFHTVVVKVKSPLIDK